MVVMDAFALPVEGTETRVNAQADAYEYMVEYSTINEHVCALAPSNRHCFIFIYFWSSRSEQTAMLLANCNRLSICSPA